MCTGIGSIVTIFVFIGALVVNCDARNGMDSQYPYQTSIECYECNSMNDPRCKDPFDPFTIGIVNCSKKKPLDHLLHARPKLCRKTVQIVEGETRVIRGCGYVPSDRDDKTCMRKTGTKNVIVHYCSCTSTLCNTGNLQVRPSIFIKTIIIGLMFYVALIKA